MPQISRDEVVEIAQRYCTAWVCGDGVERCFAADAVLVERPYLTDEGGVVHGVADIAAHWRACFETRRGTEGRLLETLVDDNSNRAVAKWALSMLSPAGDDPDGNTVYKQISLVQVAVLTLTPTTEGWRVSKAEEYWQNVPPVCAVKTAEQRHAIQVRRDAIRRKGIEYQRKLGRVSLAEYSMR